MADVALRHSAPSPTLRDKIRLFEGRSSSNIQHVSSISINRTVSSADFTSSAPYRGPRLSPARNSSIERDRHIVGESSRRRISESAPVPPILPITTTTTTTTTSIREEHSGSLRQRSTPDPSISPRKWNVITLDPEHIPIASTATASSFTTSSPPLREKGKEKVSVLSVDYDRDLIDSDEESSPKQKPILAKSPRSPSLHKKYEEEVLELKNMTAEERDMIKALVKLTTRKNKMLDALEANTQREKEVLTAKVETEKAALVAKLQSLDSELTTKSRDLTTEVVRNTELTEKIQKLERERQDIRVALAASKRESRQCKINCDAELNKKTQSLMDMAMQLTALTCLRQSMNCIICEEKVATAVLQPCRHMVMCGPCSQKVTKCPMCRVDIRNKFEIYNNWVI